MNSAIVIWCFIGAVLAQPPLPPGCEWPEKTPSECCDGLSKFIDGAALKACMEKCKPSAGPGGGPCCMATCVTDAVPILKDGKFDKDATVKRISDMGADWAAFANAATVDACANEASRIPSPPACDSFESGMMIHCIGEKLFNACPKPTAGAECDKTRKFFKDCKPMPPPPRN